MLDTYVGRYPGRKLAVEIENPARANVSYYSYGDYAIAKYESRSDWANASPGLGVGATYALLFRTR